MSNTQKANEYWKRKNELKKLKLELEKAMKNNDVATAKAIHKKMSEL